MIFNIQIKNTLDYLVHSIILNQNFPHLTPIKKWIFKTINKSFQVIEKICHINIKTGQVDTLMANLTMIQY